MSDMAIDYRLRPISVDDYHRMGEAGIFGPDERVELLDGELIAVPPMGSRHGGTMSELSALLTRTLGESVIVRSQCPVILDDRSEPEPDVAVVAREAHRWLDRHPGPHDVFLVIEVGDSSRDFDLRKKAPIYARAGVRELWVVDVVDRRLIVHRDPGPHGYAVTRVLRPGERIAPLAFPDISLPVADVVVV